MLLETNEKNRSMRVVTEDIVYRCHIINNNTVMVAEDHYGNYIAPVEDYSYEGNSEFDEQWLLNALRRFKKEVDAYITSKKIIVRKRVLL